MRIYIVRNKADKRPISEQIQEQCERVSFEVGGISYDKNYLILWSTNDI